jgi:4-amino-4-deoxy-L-arabinose transferase-like glycosyltransferase
MHAATSFSPTAMTARAERLALLGATALALGLRLYHFQQRLPWMDEVQTRLYADGPLLWPLQRALAGPPLTNPPLYFALMKLLRYCGLESLRLPSVVFGAAAVPLLFVVGRRLAGGRVGLWAAALLAISPLHVRYSQEARCYALLIAEELAFFWAALSIAREPRRRDLVLFVLCGVALGATHYLGVAVAAVGGAGLFWLRRERAVLAGVAAMALCLVPVAALAVIGSAGMHAAREPLTLDHVRAYLGWFGYQMGAPLDLGVWLLPLFVAAGLAARRSRELAFVVAAAAIPTFLFAAMPSQYRFFVRYALPLLPVVLLVAACGIDAIFARSGIEGHLLALLACGLLAARPLARLYHERGTPYDRLGALLDRERRPGEPVWFIHIGDEPIEFYAPEIVATLAPYVRAPVEVRRLSEHASAATWRIAWGPPEFRPQSGAGTLVLAPHDELTRPEFDVLGQGSHFSILVEPPRHRVIIDSLE